VNILLANCIPQWDKQRPMIVATSLPNPTCTNNIKSKVKGAAASWLFSVLVSGMSSPSLSPGRGHCIVFLGKTLAPTVPVFNWLPANINAGGSPAQTNISPRGE